MNKSLYIGIDPDVEKSGVATWLRATQELGLNKLRFFELYDYLQQRQRIIKEVRIEAGWLNQKSNFHFSRGQTKSVGERIAKNVGSNHEVGRKIAEMCEHLRIPYRLIKPTMSKARPEYFQKITGISEKNQEKIDSAMLVFGL